MSAALQEPDTEAPNTEARSLGQRLTSVRRWLWAPLPKRDAEAPPSAVANIRRFALWPRVWVIIAAIVFAYGLIGIFAIPPFVKSRIIAEVEARYGRTIQIGQLGINPFTLTLDLRDVRVPDADGADAIAFDLLRLNLSGSSLWRGGLAFDEVRLDAPRVRLERRADGRVNLSDFAPEPSAEPQEPLRLYIHRLSVADGAVAYSDLARARPFSKRAQPIAFTLTDFATYGEGSAFTLSASGDRGERVSWSGTFSLEPFASRGAFDLGALDLPTLIDWFGAELPFTLQSGALDVRGDYDLNLAGETPLMQIDLAAGALRNLGIRPAADAPDWMTLENGAISDARIDLGARSVTIGEVVLQAPYLLIALERDGGLNLAQLAPPGAAGPAGAVSGASGPEPPWRVSAASVRVLDGRFTIEDRSPGSPARFELTQANVTANGVAIPGDAPLTLEGQARVNETGSLSAAGQVLLDPMNADLTIEASGVDLRPLQPYLDAATSMRLRSGVASAGGALRYDARNGVRFRGDARVEGLRTIDAALGQDFVVWRAMTASGIDLRTEPFALRVRRIGLDGAYARVVVGADGQVNVASALRPAGAQQPPVVLASTDDSIGVAPATPAPPREALPIEIGAVRIDNSALNFADYSIQPNVAVSLQQLSGTVTGLSGAADARADVALEGSVDRYAPATIEGQVNYFAAQSFTDIAMRFRNMEMTTLSPYSGRFAGYEVERGKLDVDLNYRVENQRLDARHRIVITQLQLGDRVESDQRVRIPVRLAIALLTDRNGVIDIDLPVTGTLDDPRFRLGPIIWRIIMNLITSPFALLSGLGGGGEANLEYVAFAPGEAALDEAAQGNLQTLRAAMAERPGISIDVPMANDPVRDLEGLRAVRVRAMEREAAADRLGRRADAPGAIEEALSDPDERQEALERVYRQLTGARPDIPDAPEGADETAHNVEWLERESRAHVAVTDADLAELGRARAAAVQDALLASGDIDPARVFVIAQREAPTETEGAVRMRLAVTQ